MAAVNENAGMRPDTGGWGAHSSLLCMRGHAQPCRPPATNPIAMPALRIGSGGEMPAVLNAANEVAVETFLQQQCPFHAIADGVAATVEAWSGRNRPLDDLEQIFAVDREARRLATEYLSRYKGWAKGSEA